MAEERANAVVVENSHQDPSQTQPIRPNGRRLPWRRKLFFALIALVFGVIAIEGFCSIMWLSVRWFERPTRIVPQRADRLQSGEVMEAYHSRYDEELGWTHIPGRALADFYGPGLNMTINQDGVRGNANYVGQKSPGVYRVVCLGDSMTMGYGVDDADTYPARLAAINSEIQVVNMGMGGYSTLQCGIWYRRMHANLEADLLVFSFIAEDVLRVDYSLPKFEIVDGRIAVSNVPVPRHFQMDKTRDDAIRFFEFLVENSAMARTVDSLIPRDVASRSGVVRDPLQMTIAMIVEVAHLAKNAHQDFAVVLLVDSDEIPGRRDFNFEEQRVFWIVSRAIEEATGRLGVGYLNQLSSFAAQDSDELEKLYLKEIYNHYSPEGNQLVAETIDAWLVTRIPRYPHSEQPGDSLPARPTD